MSRPLLLDSNAVIRLFQDRLSADALSEVRQAQQVFVSYVTFWEFAIKTALGKLSPLLPGLEKRLKNHGFELLPITLEHILQISFLPHHHRDPFDRMLVAQAQREGLTIVTSDRVISEYGVATLDA